MTSKEVCSSRRWRSCSRSARRRSPRLKPTSTIASRTATPSLKGGVKIHYASLGPKEAGTAPLVVMIHGFPDFWYSWRHQMAALSDRFHGRRHRSARLQPERQAGRRRELRHAPARRRRRGGHPPSQARDRATIVGHDWGGAVAWQFALRPAADDGEPVILNLPHPNGLLRELQSNKEQIANSEYARNFQTKSPERSDGLLRKADDRRDDLVVGADPEPPASDTWRHSSARTSRRC